MRELRTCGSVGGLGGEPPESTRNLKTEAPIGNHSGHRGKPGNNMNTKAYDFSKKYSVLSR